MSTDSKKTQDLSAEIMECLKGVDGVFSVTLTESTPAAVDEGEDLSYHVFRPDGRFITVLVKTQDQKHLYYIELAHKHCSRPDRKINEVMKKFFETQSLSKTRFKAELRQVETALDR